MGYLSDKFSISQKDNISPVSCYQDEPAMMGMPFGIFDTGSLIVRYALLNKQHQIRQNCRLDKVEFFVGDTMNLTSIAFEFWRRVDFTSDLTNKVAETNEILAGDLFMGPNEVSLIDQGIDVLEGDTVVIRVTASALPCQPLSAQVGISSAEIWEYRSNTAPSSTSFNWRAQTLHDDHSIAIKFWGQQPKLIVLGDSIMSGGYRPTGGSADHASYAVYGNFSRPWIVDNRRNSFTYKIAELLGVDRYQNLGVNSNRTLDIASRFTLDFEEMRPDLTILEGGVNDLAARTDQYTIDNYTIMLNAAQAASNIVVGLSIFPASNISDTDAASRRAINSSLATLFASYSNAYFVNCDDLLGITRTSTGELDDLNPIYAANDGIHLLEKGLDAIAQHVYSFLVSNGLHKL